MAIYTRAGWAWEHDPCEDGRQRGQDALARLGLTPDTPVTIQQVLQHTTLQDALFCFIRVESRSVEQARTVIGEYIATVAGYLLRFTTITDGGEVLKNLAGPLNAHYIDKKDRTALLAKLAKALPTDHELPQNIVWYEGLRIILSDKPVHLIAMHATQKLLEGAKIATFEDEMRDTITDSFRMILNKYAPE